MSEAPLVDGDARTVNDSNHGGSSMILGQGLGDTGDDKNNSNVGHNNSSRDGSNVTKIEDGALLGRGLGSEQLLLCDPVTEREVELWGPDLGLDASHEPFTSSTHSATGGADNSSSSSSSSNGSSSTSRSDRSSKWMPGEIKDSSQRSGADMREEHEDSSQGIKATTEPVVTMEQHHFQHHHRAKPPWGTANVLQAAELVCGAMLSKTTPGDLTRVLQAFIWSLGARPSPNWWRTLEAVTLGKPILPHHQHQYHHNHHQQRLGVQTQAHHYHRQQQQQQQQQQQVPQQSSAAPFTALFPYAACHLMSSMALAGWGPSTAWLSTFDTQTLLAMESRHFSALELTRLITARTLLSNPTAVPAGAAQQRQQHQQQLLHSKQPLCGVAAPSRDWMAEWLAAMHAHLHSLSPNLAMQSLWGLRLLGCKPDPAWLTDLETSIIATAQNQLQHQHQHQQQQQQQQQQLNHHQQQPQQQATPSTAVSSAAAAPPPPPPVEALPASLNIWNAAGVLKGFGTSQHSVQPHTVLLLLQAVLPQQQQREAKDVRSANVHLSTATTEALVSLLHGIACAHPCLDVEQQQQQQQQKQKRRQVQKRQVHAPAKVQQDVLQVRGLLGAVLQEVLARAHGDYRARTYVHSQKPRTSVSPPLHSHPPHPTPSPLQLAACLWAAAVLRLTPPPAWTHAMLAHLAESLQNAPLAAVTFTLTALCEGWGEGLRTDPGMVIPVLRVIHTNPSVIVLLSSVGAAGEQHHGQRQEEQHISLQASGSGRAHAHPHEQQQQQKQEEQHKDPLYKRVSQLLHIVEGFVEMARRPENLS